NVALDAFDAGDRAGAQEIEHGSPVIGRPVAQEQRHFAVHAGRYVAAGRSAQRRGRSLKQGRKSLVEPAQATEPGCHGDLGHRQGCLVDQLLGEQDPAGLGNRYGRGAEVLTEQPAKLPLADPQPIGQGADACLVQHTHLDERKRSRDGVRNTAPSAEIWRGLRPAAETWPEAGLLGCSGGWIEDDILRARGPRGADRTAINPRRLDGREEAAIKAGVADRDGAVAGVVVEVHTALLPHHAALSRGFRTRWTVQSPQTTVAYRVRKPRARFRRQG